MKKLIMIRVMALALILGLSATAQAAPDIKDILKGAGGAIGNMVEGVFSKKDLTVSDIAGQWTANGSAVSFKSDNMLKKAGGLAAAGAVESQLNEYYKKYGLNNVVFTVKPDSTFTLGFKKISIGGTISVKSKGVFTLSFKAFGGFGLGKMDAYVEKSGNNMDLMFEADKIKSIISFAATISGSKLASTADKMLKQYDGICMGFKMKKTAEAAGSKTSGSTTSGKTGSTSTKKATEKSDSGSGLGSLLEIFTRKK